MWKHTLLNFAARVLGESLSNLTKDRPEQLRPDDLPDEFDDLTALREVVDSIVKDQATLNTALNRIERKQNRWLDILNLKDDMLPAETPAVIKTDPTPPPAYAGSYPGQETTQ
ncbi:hypothetical protein ES705_34293 [subsurface metagenome]